MGGSPGVLVAALCLLLAWQGPVAAATTAAGTGVEGDAVPTGPAVSSQYDGEAPSAGTGSAAVPPSTEHDGAVPAGESGRVSRLPQSNRTDRAAADAALRSRSTDRANGSIASAGRPSATTDPIEETAIFRRVPHRPGVVEVTVELRVPESVAALEFSAPEGTEAVRLEGFSAIDRSTYEWDDGSDGGTLTLRMPANGTDPAGRVASVDAGEWALVRPRYDFTWWSRGSTPPLETTVRVADEGVAGETYAYLGPGETIEVEGREPIRLVAPETADLPDATGPRDLASLLASVSEDLAVGGAPAETMVFVAPTAAFGEARLGWQTGDADAVVLDGKGVASTAVHEYVHVRQNWRGTDETRWLAEATANYYEWYYALERDRWTFDRFARVMAATPDESAVLADPSTWDDELRGDRADYQTGALVVGDLDRRIRLETGGAATFQDVFAELNRRQRRIEGADVFRALESVGGPGVRAAGETYVTTRVVPEMWNATAHRAAFGPSNRSADPEISYAFAGDEFRVTRPAERTGLGYDDPVAVGESVAVAVRVENAGGAAGAYEATLRVNGEVVDAAEGRIVADAERTEFLGVRFVEPGTYTLAVGEREREITVERVRPAVRGLTVEPEAAIAGDPVTIRLTVEADGDRPASGPVPVELSGDHTGTIAVGEGLTLRPSERETVEVTAAFEVGTYTFSVGNRSRILTVEPRPGPSMTEIELEIGAGTETDAGTPIGTVTAERGIVTPVTPVVGGGETAADEGPAPSSETGSAGPATDGSAAPDTDPEPAPTADADGGGDRSPGFDPIAAALALAALAALGRRR